MAAVEDGLNLVPEVSVGTDYTFLYSFESTTDDTDGDGSSGLYPQAAGNLVVSMGDTVFSCIEPDTYDIQVFDDGDNFLGDDQGDEYVVAASGCGALDSEATLELIELLLVDLDDKALSDDELPTTPPDLTQWDANLTHLVVAGCPTSNPACSRPSEDGYSIVASVDEIVLVPEPGLAALQATALLAVGLVARSRRRSPSGARARKRPSA